MSDRPVTSGRRGKNEMSGPVTSGRRDKNEMSGLVKEGSDKKEMSDRLVKKVTGDRRASRERRVKLNWNKGIGVHRRRKTEKGKLVLRNELHGRHGSESRVSKKEKGEPGMSGN
jgi:hypothetical protein